MKNPTVVKVLTGILCALLVMVGVVWFFVYQKYKDSNKQVLTTVEVTAEPEKEPKDVSMPEIDNSDAEIPLETPDPKPTPIDMERIGTPNVPQIIETDLAKSLGITKENYPLIDGSTSTFYLVESLYWQMFESDPDYDYDEATAEPYGGAPRGAAKTVPSYKSLIAGDVDLIIVPDPSKEVRALEKKNGVELEYIPIGLEGLIFITHKNNPVDNITLEQANKIYADMTITNWAQLGGRDGEIAALCRNEESGSQAQFDNLVMEEGKSIDPRIKEQYALDEMQEMLWAVARNESLWINGEEVGQGDDFTLGYSIYYYLKSFEGQKGSESVDNIKTMTVNDIEASPETIASKEYPLSVSYFAVIRKDAPKDSPERIIANWLTTKEGQQQVEWAGLGKIRK